jgi:predicted dehydrogenase
MWTRCLPHFRELRAVLDSGRLGDVRLIIAEHGIGFPADPSHRIYDQELAGGALLDLGVYVLWLASFVFGFPREITVDSAPAMTGVDAQTAIICRYPEGQQAVLSTSIETLRANRAVIAGRNGRIEIEGTWYRPTRFSVIPRLAIASDGEADPVPRYLGLGLRVERPFAGRPQDSLSLGLARASLRGQAHAETVLELGYAYKLAEGLYLQPDVQRIWHAAGDGPAATVLTLRAHIEY